ncbi:MAG: carbonic anhydrase [Leptospiraceae bacterium]|nr:carbonic anhydrase [Leptospiraceae bacterium]MCB1305289.1 carbonic anhydrase [Leptospiraceae bacterium]
MESYRELLDGNLKWLTQVKEADPTIFDRLSEGQSPKFLWIGCSDSRVPATEITGSIPGSIFVHRNIANLVVHTDTNLLSVLYFAVEYLNVKHILVVGHSSCGGIKAAMSDESFGFLDNWLNHIRDVRNAHKPELELITNEADRTDALAMINVRQQVINLSRVSFIRQKWQTGEFPVLHGWYYQLKDGMLRDLNISMNSVEQSEKFLAGL